MKQNHMNMGVSIYYPQTKLETIEYEVGSYELRVVAKNGNIDVFMDAGGDTESQIPLEEDDVYYWEGVVLYHNDDDWKAYNLQDVRRAAQVCHLLGTCPTNDHLAEFIGYNNGHGLLPDDWNVVKERVLLSFYGGSKDGNRS